MKLSFILSADAERVKVIYDDIAAGSESCYRFYILVIVSTLIACFGLMANSTAVVIGAMLVAPLMTPIFGISLSLIRGDATLLSHAVKAEGIGVISAVIMSYLLGLLFTVANPYPEVTLEMLARTEPNLFDLIVAVLAGFAGAYALVDEKISPALPGVAIATAIVPPLANSGLCLAYGAYQGAVGSFLLFFANFLSILLVASAIFVKAGMMHGSKMTHTGHLARRFVFAGLCFFAIALFLGNTLFSMIEDRKLYSTIRSILVTEFSAYPATSIDKLVIDNVDEQIYVLVQIHSPKQVSPDHVLEIEKHVSAKTKFPVRLIVRTIRSNDISSTGSNSTVVAQGLDGFYLNDSFDPAVQMIRISEQVTREYLATQIGYELLKVDYVELLQGPTVLVMITGIRELFQAEVDQLEQIVRERTGNPELHLMIRYIQVELMEKQGRIRYGWSSPFKLDARQNEIQKKIKQEIRNFFVSNPDHILDNLSICLLEKEYSCLAEIQSNAPFKRSELIKLQEKISDLVDKPLKLYIWLDQGAVLTDNGLRSYDELTDIHLKKYGHLAERVNQILQSQK